MEAVAGFYFLAMDPSCFRLWVKIFRIRLRDLSENKKAGSLRSMRIRVESTAGEGKKHCLETACFSVSR